jgi:xylulokinase
MLNNKEIGASIHRMNFNVHNESHLIRAAQEGIVYSFHYGMEIMKQTGINPSVIRAGNANMFLSSIFRETLATLTGATIELYHTDGAEGAAKGAGIGSGMYASFDEAFASLKQIEVIEPDNSKSNFYMDLYKQWNEILLKEIQ